MDDSMDWQCQPSRPSQWLALALLSALVVPMSIQVAVAQDGSTTITVATPAKGAAPQPLPPIGDALSEPAAEQPSTLESSAEQPTEVLDTAHKQSAPTETGEPAETTAVAAEVSPPAQASSVESDLNSTAAEFDTDEIDELVSGIADSIPASTAPASDSTHNLSVPIGMASMLPEDHPAWIVTGNDLSGKVHRLIVDSFPTVRPEKADRALDERLVAVVSEYIDHDVIEQYGASAHLPITADFIRKNLLNDPQGYLAELTTGEGPMYQKWVSLEVTPEQRQQFTKWYQEARQRQRIAPLGFGLVGIVGLVGFMHLILRRKNSPATSQPVNQAHLAASQDDPSLTTRRSGGGWVAMLLIIGLCMIVPLLFAVVFVTPSRVVRSHQVRQAGEVAHQLEAQLRAQEIHGQALQNSTSEVIFGTNGQKVIITHQGQ